MNRLRHLFDRVPGPDWAETGLAAVDVEGSPIRPETYSKAFAAHRAAAAGVPVIRLHHTVCDGQVARARPGGHAAGLRRCLRRRTGVGR